MLTDNGSFTDWFISVADDVPARWGLFESSDSGATWTLQGTENYPDDIPFSITSGDWAMARRCDAFDVPYGPDSNIIVVP